MFCKSSLHRNKGAMAVIVATGVVLMAFGTLWGLKEQTMSGKFAMLMGMFTGIGAVALAFGIYGLFHLRFAPKEKLREEERSLRDERLIQVRRSAYTISNLAATILFSALIFTFTILDDRTPALITAGALCLQSLTFIVSYRILEKRM
jgi:hypothetical protein